MTAGGFLLILWRQRLVAALLVLLTLLSTSVYLQRAERVYTATSTVGVYPQQGTEEGFGGLIGPLLGTLVDVVRSNDNLEDARSRVAGAPPVYELRGAVTAQAVTDTFVLRVSVDNADPALAADLVTAIVTALPRRELFSERIQYAVLETAGIPSTPTSPRTRLVYALSLVLAAALATAGALLSDARRRRADRPEDVVQALGVPVLASLEPPAHPTQHLGEEDSPTAEGLRSLRIALKAAGTSGALVVTSASEPQGQGREAWVASGLAVALAQVGQRVLLVQARADADPGALLPAGSGGADAGGADGASADPAVRLPGLSDALRGDPVEDLLRPTLARGVCLLTAGTRPADLPELLETDFGRLVRVLRAQHDVVIVDVPPLTRSDDARVMAQTAPVLVTVELGRADERALREVAAALRVVSATVVGCGVVTGQAPGLLRRVAGR